MNRRLVILFSFIYVLFMAALSIFYYLNHTFYLSLVGIGGVICGAIPLLLALFTRLQFNLRIIISYLIFLFGSQYFGSILGWYGRIDWWDTFLHVISGVILAFTGIALFERLVHRNAGKEISPWLVFLFIISFAVLGGVIWEIYEFSCDQFFKTKTQGGNTDTMTDLIADTVGGFVIALWTGFRAKMKINNH